MRVIHKQPLRRKPTGDSMALYKRLTTYSKQYWPWLLMAVVANMTYSGIDALFTYLMKPLLDNGFVNPDPTFLKWLPLIIIVLFALRSFMNLAGDYTMAKVSRSIVVKFRQAIFDKLLRLPCKNFDQESSGQLLS